MTNVAHNSLAEAPAIKKTNNFAANLIQLG